jgi:uncharacterized LabA/DUF88 family protein
VNSFQQEYFMSEEKMVILIDGPNLYAAAKTLGFDLDYKKLLTEFRTRGNLVRAKYYTAVDDADEFSNIVPLIDWLDYNGYSVVTKSMKSFTDGEGRRKTKGNMNVDIAVEAMELAPYVGHIVLFSGDGDFRAAVEAVQRRGVRVTVISSIASQPPICADELRRQADVFIDLVELRPKISRGSGGRPPRDSRQLPQFVAGPRENSVPFTRERS